MNDMYVERDLYRPAGCNTYSLIGFEAIYTLLSYLCFNSSDHNFLDMKISWWLCGAEKIFHYGNKQNELYEQSQLRTNWLSESLALYDLNIWITKLKSSRETFCIKMMEKKKKIRNYSDEETVDKAMEMQWNENCWLTNCSQSTFMKGITKHNCTMIINQKLQTSLCNWMLCRKESREHYVHFLLSI